MKQASRWLLLAMALVLLPQAAFAQKKKSPKSADTPAADTAGKPVDLGPASVSAARRGGRRTRSGWPAPSPGGVEVVGTSTGAALAARWTFPLYSPPTLPSVRRPKR